MSFLLPILCQECQQQWETAGCNQNSDVQCGVFCFRRTRNILILWKRYPLFNSCMCRNIRTCCSGMRRIRIRRCLSRNICACCNNDSRCTVNNNTVFLGCSLICSRRSVSCWNCALFCSDRMVGCYAKMSCRSYGSRRMYRWSYCAVVSPIRRCHLRCIRRIRRYLRYRCCSRFGGGMTRSMFRCSCTICRGIGWTCAGSSSAHSAGMCRCHRSRMRWRMSRSWGSEKRTV